MGVGDRDGMYVRISGGGYNRYERSEDGARYLTRDTVQNIVTQGIGQMAEAVQKAMSGVNWSDLEGALQQITQIAQVTDNGKATQYQNIASRNLDFVGNFQGSLQELAWVRDTYEPLINDGAWDELSSFKRALKSLDDQWKPLIEHAEQLGLATEELSAVYQQLTLEAQQANQRAIAQAEGNITIRGLRLQGTPEANQEADLLAFDLQAAEEKAEFQQLMRDLAVSAEEAAAQMVRLEEVQAQERLAIIQRYADQAKAIEEQRSAAAGSIVISMSDYVRRLRMSDASPLTPQQKWEAESREFDAVLGAAQAGDWTSLTQLTGYADALLATSRDVHGSGAAYVADFKRVLDALEKVGQMPADTLTASIMQAETRTQTATLVEELGKLRSEVVALRREVAQGSAAPARVAA